MAYLCDRRKENTINTDVFCALEAQNYGTYNVFISSNKNYNIYHVFVVVPRMTQNIVFIYEKDQNTLFDHICFLSATKNIKRLLKDGSEAISKSIL